MKQPTTRRHAKSSAQKSVSEFLILADGRILAHNLSTMMAGLLAEMNPDDEAMRRRALRKNILKHELPN